MAKKQGSAANRRTGRTSPETPQGASRTKAARSGERVKSEPEGSGQRPSAQPEAATGGTQEVPAGLDDVRHAAAQRAAHQAAILKELIIPANMAAALPSSSGLVEAGGIKTYLDQLLEDAGRPQDPVAVMLLQQLTIAHFRLGELHARAGQATGENCKLLNAATSRLLGEFRRLVLTWREYRRPAQDGNAKEAKLRVFRAAQ